LPNSETGERRKPLTPWEQAENINNINPHPVGGQERVLTTVPSPHGKSRREY